MQLLEYYINEIEERLIKDFEVSKGFSHSVNQGSVREHFIRDFLSIHFNETFAFGSGEIIDAISTKGQARNQFDIVMYNKNYPKLSVGGITAFLAESVISTIEIKSTLRKKDLKEAIKAAEKAKKLEPNFIHNMRYNSAESWIPPRILNYLVAYKCSVRMMETILKWVKEIYQELGITDSDVGTNNPMTPRTEIPSKALDGIFVLGQGFILFDNAPSIITDNIKTKHPEHSEWLKNEQGNGSLLILFYLLLAAVSNIQGKCLNPHPYFKNLSQK